MFTQLKLRDHPGVQMAHDEGIGRGAVTRRKFLGHGGPAYVRLAFQHQDMFPGAGEIGSAGQAVVPGADDNGVIFLRA